MGIKRTVSIRRIDLWGNEPLESKKIKQKMQKTEMSTFVSKPSIVLRPQRVPEKNKAKNAKN